MTGSHLITDMTHRWMEIEFDRDDAEVANEPWAPFAKAFAEVPFPYLNEVPLRVALRLRKQERLGDLRGFLGKAWRTCREDDVFSGGNVGSLAIELKDRIREADAEWQTIRTSMAKKLIRDITVGSVAVASGLAEWLPPGIAAAGVATRHIVDERGNRKAYLKRHPASFLLSMSKDKMYKYSNHLTPGLAEVSASGCRLHLLPG